MPEKDNINSVIFLSRAGCLLPSLIGFNLLFGWLFFGFFTWLLIEGILIFLFLLNSYILMRSIKSSGPKKDNVIDVEGEVLEDKQKLK